MLIKILALRILINFVIFIKADSVDNYLTVGIVVPRRTFMEVESGNNFYRIMYYFRLLYTTYLTQFPNLWKRIMLKTVIWPTDPTTQCKKLKREKESECSLLHVVDTFCEEFLQNNVSVIIIVYKYESDVIQFRYLMQLSNDVGIPVIIKKSVRDLGSPHPSVIFETNPSLADEAKTMLNIISVYEFRQVCVITSSTAYGEEFYQELDKMQKISTFSVEILAHIKLRVSEDKELMTGRMFDLKKIHPKCRTFVLHISKDEAQQMFPAAENIGWTGKEYQWIVTRSVYTHIEKDDPHFPIATMGIFYDLFDEQPYSPFITTSMADDLTIKYVKFLKYVGLFGDIRARINNQWILALDKSVQILESGLLKYLSESDSNRLEDLKPDVNCGRDSHERWTKGTALHKLFPLNKVLDIVQVNPWHGWSWVSLTAIYSFVGNSIGYSVCNTEIQLMTSVDNRKQEHFNVFFFEDPPFVITRTPDYHEKCKLPEVNCTVSERINSAVVPSNDSDQRCCSGLFIDFLVMLHDSLNFTYNLQRVNDRKWKEKINETWYGMINELTAGGADIVASLIIKPEIEWYGSHSNLILNSSIAIMVAKKTDFPPAHAILQPFDILIWFVIVFVLIQVETWLIFAFEWLSPSGLNMKKILPQNHHFTVTQTYWLTLTMLFKAPMRTITPRGWSSLAIANSWAAFALVFIAIYTAKLANFMITTESYYKFKGITDERLLKSDMKVGTVSLDSIAVILQNDFPQLYQRMKPFNRVNVSEGIKALKARELDAFIYDGVVLDYLAAKDKDCELITLGNRYAHSGYGIVFGWFNASIIYIKIDRLIESGIISAWRDRWVGEPCKANSNFQSISFDQFKSAFILLGLGIAIAAIIFVMEHCYSRYMLRVKRKQQSKEIVNSWWNLVTQVRLPVQESLDEASHLPTERD